MIDKQIRNTKARQQILDVLHDSNKALSQSEIQNRIGNLCDRVTTYRVLDRLTEEGRIHRVADVSGGVRFATCKTCKEHHHHDHLHFSCTECKSIMCLNDSEVQFKIPPGFVIKETYFTLSGICRTCSSPK